MGIKVSPRSRNEICSITNFLRDIFGCDGRINIVLLLEKIVEKEVFGLDFEILNDDDKRLEGAVAKYLPTSHTIIIRESIYLEAARSNNRQRFTIAHELGHAILHKDAIISFARTEEKELKAYENPEWQANEFAGNLLLPLNNVHGRDINMLSLEYGVSHQVAKIQHDKIYGRKK